MSILEIKQKTVLFYRPVVSSEKQKQTAYVVSRQEMNEVGNRLTPKIKRNAKEKEIKRLASDFVVR